MRRNIDIPSEPIVAIDVVAANVGQLPEIIWGKLKESDVRPDWNHAPSVTWTKARALYDEVTAAMSAVRPSALSSRLKPTTEPSRAGPEISGPTDAAAGRSWLIGRPPR